jgi:hypothetical protein
MAAECSAFGWPIIHEQSGSEQIGMGLYVHRHDNRESCSQLFPCSGSVQQRQRSADQVGLNLALVRRIASGDLRAEGILAGTPSSIGSAISACDNHGVAIRIAHPALPVVRSPIAVRRIAMAGYYNFDTHFGHALHHRVKVVDLEPKQYAVSIWLVMTITNAAVMMFQFEAMQLKHELTI